MIVVDDLTKRGVFLLVVLLSLGALLIAVLRSKKRVQTSPSPRSLWDYLLVWPVVFDQPTRRERVARGGRFLTTGEVVGATVFLLVLILALIFG